MFFLWHAWITWLDFVCYSANRSNYSVADEIKSISSNSLPSEYEGTILQEASTPKDSDTDEEPLCREWVEPRLNMSQVQVLKSPVQEAFQLLQSDPNVKVKKFHNSFWDYIQDHYTSLVSFKSSFFVRAQGAVISIVSDPDVWHAMMKNEKVQELKRIFQKSQGCLMEKYTFNHQY